MRVLKFLALVLALIIPLLASAPVGAEMADRWSSTTELSAGPEVLVMRDSIGQLFFRSLSGTPAGDFDLAALAATTLRAIDSEPATYVDDSSGTPLFRVYFIEDVNNDIHYFEVDLGTATPTVTQALVAEAGLLGFTPRNVAITQQHAGVTNWLAVSSDDNSIYLLPGQTAPDYNDIKSIVLQPPTPSDTAKQICYINPEAMDFDFTGRFLAYDAMSCIEDVGITCPTTAAGCDIAGIPYYSIGVVDLTDYDGTTGEVFDHPLTSDDSAISRANPEFSSFNNWTMAFDEVTSTTNEVYTVDFKSALTPQDAIPQLFVDTLISGVGPVFGAPSYFVDDSGLVNQGEEVVAFAAWNDPENEIYATDPTSINVLLASGFHSHTVLRVGERSIAVDPQPQPLTSLDFGAIVEGGSSSLFLTINNAGTRSFTISSATPTDTSHYQVATPLPIEVSAQGINFIAVNYDAGTVVGTFNDQLQIVADVPGGLLTAELLASTIADTSGGGGTTPPPDTTTDDTTEGVAHDEGDFIGPCFIGALN